MGSAQSAATCSDEGQSSLLPSFGKDVTSLIVTRSDVLDLGDFAACMLVCKLWRRLLNNSDGWTAQLKRYCDEQYHGRSGWPGYELIPTWCSWTSELTDRIQPGTLSLIKRALTPDTKLTLQQHQALPIDTATPTFRHVFATKKVILDQRWDEFTGPGTLVVGRLMEGYFSAGRLIVGVLYDIDGDHPVKVYQGFFLNGLRHGRGISYYRDGTKSYEGTFECDRYAGIGTEYWPNGNVKYTGNFVFGSAQGYGVGHFSQGVYEGNWSRGKQQGTGAWLWRNGARYIGEMNAGKRSGHGTQYWPGSKLLIQYVGEWSDDRPHGLVKKYFESGDSGSKLEYEGMYANGLPQGEGTLFWESSGNPRYTGLWKKGNFHGLGIEYSEDGALVYSGNFALGLYHGEGRTGERVGDWLRGNPVDDPSALAIMDQYMDEDGSGDEDETGDNDDIDL